MQGDQLEKMARIAQAQYLRAFEAARPVLEREASLRADLWRLDEQEARNREAGPGDATALRVLGADILWQGWTERTRRDLNAELARVMAQKLEIMEGVRKHFGRHQALLQIAKAEKAAKKQAMRKRFEEGLINPGR